MTSLLWPRQLYPRRSPGAMPPLAWHLAACAAALLLLAPAAHAATETVDVCVIGAGPSGIGAALALADKGKTVTLLERDDRAGGQTKPCVPPCHLRFLPAADA